MMASARVFAQGLLAYNSGIDKTCNPHPSRYTTHLHWENGWETGFDEDNLNIDEDNEEGV